MVQIRYTVLKLINYNKNFESSILQSFLTNFTFGRRDRIRNFNEKHVRLAHSPGRSVHQLSECAQKEKTRKIYFSSVNQPFKL